MTVLSLLWAALRVHAPSLLFTLVLLAFSSSLLHSPVPLALLLWASVTSLTLWAWYALESFTLRRLGCRSAGHLDRERIDAALNAAGIDVPVEVLVIDAAEPFIGR